MGGYSGVAAQGWRPGGGGHRGVEHRVVVQEGGGGAGGLEPPLSPTL